jgi:hypothetical protein
MDDDRRIIIDRANRMLKQSKTLRKMSDELLQEAKDIRASVNTRKPTKRKRARR